MPGATRTTTPAQPWHLWVVGILGGLWSVMQVVSFLLTQLDVAAVMSRFPPEQRAYFASWPLWADGFWALGVLGGLIGCVLLLRMDRRAWPAFLVSLIGACGSSLGGLAFLGGMEVMAATGGLGLTLLPVAVAALLAAYSRVMVQKGVLG